MVARRAFGAMLLAFGLFATVGCRNRPSQLDPFLGKTTVPPPPTGSIGPQSPGLSAYPAAPPTLTTPGAAQPAGPSAMPAKSPGTFTPNSSLTAPRPLSSTTPPASTPTSVPAQNVSTPIRVVAPDPNRGNVVSSPAAPGGGVDIMDLPVRGRGVQPRTAGGSGAAGALQGYTASGSAPNVENAVAKVVTIPGTQNGYAYDETYSRLAGRLQYSSFDNRWLLRYIEPDQRPDRLGGVVILVPQGSMAGFRDGDFVTAVGRLDASGSASPVYTASNVSLQRETR